MITLDGVELVANPMSQVSMFVDYIFVHQLFALFQCCVLYDN